MPYFRHRLSLRLQICTIKMKTMTLSLKADVHLKTLIMHQNIALILWQLYYGKISFYSFIWWPSKIRQFWKQKVVSFACGKVRYTFWKWFFYRDSQTHLNNQNVYRYLHLFSDRSTVPIYSWFMALNLTWLTLNVCLLIQLFCKTCFKSFALFIDLLSP